MVHSDEEDVKDRYVEEVTCEYEHKPIVQVEKVTKVVLEDEEDVVFLMRAKVFRFDNKEGDWKERGVGDIKLLKNRKTRKVRILMRREKTHKVCVNHIITSDMNLSLNLGSNRSWMWSTAADISDGEPKQELLAVRFATKQNADVFKESFDEVKRFISESSGGEKKDDESTLDEDKTGKNDDESTLDENKTGKNDDESIIDENKNGKKDDESRTEEKARRDL